MIRHTFYSDQFGDPVQEITLLSDVRSNFLISVQVCNLRIDVIEKVAHIEALCGWRSAERHVPSRGDQEKTNEHHHDFPRTISFSQ